MTDYKKASKVIMGVPSYCVEERIFMLDCARKYLTPAWIKRLIDEIARVGYNRIMLHFSEEVGMRLESKQFPWLAGADHKLCVWGIQNGMSENDDKFITQEEMSDIVRHAMACGVEVIPSFDSPGHMNYLVKKYNEYYNTDIGNYFHKNGKTSIVQGSSAFKESVPMSCSRGIDISNPEAVKFAKALYREYGQFFRELGCRSFDIGGDELLGFGETIDDSLSKWRNLEHWDEYAKRITGSPDAVAYDAFILYMNDICKMLRDMGYESIRMWNDDVYRSFDTNWKGVTRLDKSIDIQYWSPLANNGENTVLKYLDYGHTVYNFGRLYCYYVLYPNKPSTAVTPDDIRENWNPYVFDVEVAENNPTYPDARVKGAGFCLWCDTPAAQTEDEILENIRPYFAAIAEKSS